MGADIIIYLFYGVLAYSCVAVCSSSPFSLFVCLLWLAERRRMNGPRDAPDYLRGAAEARGSARRVSCGFFGDATSHLCGCLCLCLWSTPKHLHGPHRAHSSCLFFVPERPFNSSQHQLAHLRDLTAERHAPYLAHPTPEAANELLLYTLMKYNCIMVCK